MGKIDKSDGRDLFLGLIRLQILHRAVKGPIFGLGIIEDLGQRGYKISAGTLYPVIHGLEAKGYLTTSTVRNGKSGRKVYRATPLGTSALASAKQKVRELFRELIEDE